MSPMEGTMENEMENEMEKQRKRVKATQQLHDLGQSLWLDNITRDLLQNGTLRRYRDEFSISGVTSNPTIFDHAIRNTALYDDAIRADARAGKSAEATFFDLALDDLTHAADLFREVQESTGGVDGWVSMEVSPLLAEDPGGSVAQAEQLRAQAARPNLFVKIPGTGPGVKAIEEAIFGGTPINVTLLFSSEQYLASAEAYLRGLERRMARGLEPNVPSVASLFVSRWDVAVMGKVPEPLRDRLGIAMAKRTYKAYRDLLASDRWRKLAEKGARPQRLLWASTGTKDPEAPDVLYVTSLAAPDTIVTIPDKTLLAFAEHGNVKATLPYDGGDAEEVLARFTKAGVDLDALAGALQREGIAAFDASWQDLMGQIAAKSETLRKAA